jgi:hypothetical protein
MNQSTKPMPAKSMHKFVWMCLGLLPLFTIALSIAIFRVNQMPKFKDSYVKSLTDEWKVSTASQSTQKTPASLVQNVGYQKNK